MSEREGIRTDGTVRSVDDIVDMLNRSARSFRSCARDVDDELDAALNDEAAATITTLRSQLAEAKADNARLREAALAVCAEWNEDEIGQVDGELIDDLRNATEPSK